MSDVLAAHDGGEGRRQAYLAALGIPLWSARQELPGALPGAPLEFQPYQAGEAVSELVAVEAEPAAAPAPPVKSPEPAVPHASHSVEPAATPQRASASAAADQLPRFICRVQTLAPDYSAVVTLGDAPDLSATEHRLLANIAQALGGDATAAQPCEQLRWPLNRNPAFDHSRPAMLEWLAHALKLQNPRCLVFGEEVAGYVRAAMPQVSVITAPAISDLLLDPVAKATLWKALHG
ncbi:MAG: hypothetical protein K0R03_783 [Moraxellaceae bacterium]|nr:hypothetical protein [Moraxellaceae bacterium]